jgi:hypothetical protein
MRRPTTGGAREDPASKSQFSLVDRLSSSWHSLHCPTGPRLADRLITGKSESTLFNTPVNDKLNRDLDGSTPTKEKGENVYRLLISLIVLLLSACNQTKDDEGFYGISQSASPTSLTKSGFLCKAEADAQQSCVRFDGNPNFLGEPIKEVTVNYKSGQIHAIALETARDRVTLKDVFELASKISAVYEPRKSKMNSTRNGFHQEHWNVKDGGVLRLSIFPGVPPITRDSASIIYFPPNQVSGDM